MQEIARLFEYRLRSSWRRDVSVEIAQKVYFYTLAAVSVNNLSIFFPKKSLKVSFVYLLIYSFVVILP